MDPNLIDRLEVSRAALRLYGIPYKFGGKNLDVAIDCSMFTQTVLSWFQMIPYYLTRPMSASMQLDYFRKLGCEIDRPYEGCLVFYRKGKASWHVMYCLNPEVCVGASGEDVCIRPINYRDDIVAYVDPFKANPIIKDG